MRDFNSQELANTAWAFATVGRKDERLFSTLAAAAEQRMRDFNSQELANTAWAFAVANFFSELLFGPTFAHCLEAMDFCASELCQLHQWVLWHQELKVPPPLSPTLQDRCRISFCGTSHWPSQSQRDVVRILTKLGVPVEEEEKTIQEGYSIDLVVVWKGERVAIEFDGPSHFLMSDGVRLANGATMLKHRQLRFLGWKLVAVPYWEWDEVRGSEADKCKYLLYKLKQAASSGQPGEGNGVSDVVSSQAKPSQVCFLNLNLH